VTLLVAGWARADRANGAEHERASRDRGHLITP
jgi:hypothetical protein